MLCLFVCCCVCCFVMCYIVSYCLLCCVVVIVVVVIVVIVVVFVVNDVVFVVMLYYIILYCLILCFVCFYLFNQFLFFICLLIGLLKKFGRFPIQTYILLSLWWSDLDTNFLCPNFICNKLTHYQILNEQLLLF